MSGVLGFGLLGAGFGPLGAVVGMLLGAGLGYLIERRAAQPPADEE